MNRFKTAILASILAIASTDPAFCAPPAGPIRAADFIASIGVCTHIPYTDGGYANLRNIATDLRYLGITAVRDNISNGAAGSAPLSSYIALGTAGINFTFLAGVGGDETTLHLKSTLALISSVNRAFPGRVVAIEGANEINNFKLSFNGVGGLRGALDMQRFLFAYTHSEPVLKGVAVDYFTGYDAGGIEVGPDPAKEPGLADFNTQHPYPNQGDPPAFWLSPAKALGNQKAGAGPAVYTETGYSSNSQTDGGVNLHVQAKYTLDLLMDVAKFGISRTYLYELMDAYKPGSPQGNAGFGLFDSDNAPKPVAVAIHNLTGILADDGPNAQLFKPAAVEFTISELPATGNSLALSKSNGEVSVIVWNEPKIWDPIQKKQLPAPVSKVTVTLPKRHKSLRLFDPLKEPTALHEEKDANAISFELTDHPIIIQFSLRDQ